MLEGWKDVLLAYAKQFNITKLKYVTYSGETGQKSIYNGLIEIRKYRSDDDVVIIHDGNRPMVESAIITNNLAIFNKHGSAVTAIPCTDVVFYLRRCSPIG